jgi:UDP-2,3-diacylglucosamine hydrolase
MGKIYFASDFHLGIDVKYTSREREKQLVSWFDQIKEDAEEIYLVGDLFDFWFEYKQAVPKGYVRFLGKLAELRDLGIKIFIFTGNHDMWIFDYFEKEFDIPTYRAPITKVIKGKKFYIGHGDGLGPGDHSYKLLKKVFSNRLCQWVFARLHPNFGIGLANYLSRTSRSSKDHKVNFFGEKEWLAIHSNEVNEKEPHNYFIFGHRHLPIDYTLNDNKSRYINLGDWMNYNSYAVFDGQDLTISFFENQEGKIYS